MNRIQRLKLKIKAWGWETNNNKNDDAGASSTNQIVSTKIFSTNLKNFISIARFNNTKIVFVTMILNFNENDSIEKQRKRARFANPRYTNTVVSVNKLNSVTGELASGEGIVLIDTALEKSLSREENFSDLCHFTETEAKILLISLQK